MLILQFHIIIDIGVVTSEQHIQLQDMRSGSCAAQGLLAKVFEEYYSLSDDSDTGILEGGAQTTECPPAALEPTVRLLGTASRQPQNLHWKMCIPRGMGFLETIC